LPLYGGAKTVDRKKNNRQSGSGGYFRRNTDEKIICLNIFLCNILAIFFKNGYIFFIS